MLDGFAALDATPIAGVNAAQSTLKAENKVDVRLPRWDPATHYGKLIALSPVPFVLQLAAKAIIANAHKKILTAKQYKALMEKMAHDPDHVMSLAKRAGSFHQA